MQSFVTKLIPHVIASFICVLVFTATPIVLYGLVVIVSAVTSGDIGGLLNFILIPLMSVALSLFTTFMILLPLTATLQWLSSRLKFSRWVPLLGIFPASFLMLATVALTVVKPQNPNLAMFFLVIWCLIGSACFVFYWIPLNIAEIILNKLWKFPRTLLLKSRPES